jgi:Uncharacterized protein conserved in bacteria (DUF2252)
VDIVTATTNFEQWLSDVTKIDADDLSYKHACMANVLDPLPFYRATYYRWATLWPKTCPDDAQAPRVLAVGDSHLENFGTWRDADARLCWGINDFDEADVLPYTNDLARLAASARIAEKSGYFSGKFTHICRAIFTGYEDSLAAIGLPFVLEERNPELRALATSRDPARFWNKLVTALREPTLPAPDSAVQVLHESMPVPDLTSKVYYRPCAGLGSLGKPRYVALAEWAGSLVAREAKATTPPATYWTYGVADRPGRQTEAAAKAKRAPDPFYWPGPVWICRRLAPLSSRIEIGAIAEAEDVLRTFWAMGAEIANVHLGDTNAIAALRRDFAQRSFHWLVDSAHAAADAVVVDWQQWCDHSRSDV